MLLLNRMAERPVLRPYYLCHNSSTKSLEAERETSAINTQVLY